jgi:hypothetical protein
MKPTMGGFEHDGIASISEKKSGMSFEAGRGQLMRSKAQDNLNCILDARKDSIV